MSSLLAILAFHFDIEISPCLPHPLSELHNKLLPPPPSISDPSMRQRRKLRGKHENLILLLENYSRQQTSTEEPRAAQMSHHNLN